MATLVLTAVGSAVGGPIGGALGAMLGNALDHRLLGRVREGPRLSDLSVQTSSYGTPIPAVFGTMRVAGTVIWSTDLIETRVRGSGKGQASGYSYAASFAVLLSGRPVRAIGRIWADGRLIRGAAGDLKVKGTLRLHRGAEDQPVDPLIASAEGAGMAPAYRGMAYLLWEELALDTFGNRIPQLTVEVIADPAPVAAGSIAAALAPEVTGGMGTAIAGFAATGSVRGVLEVLAEAGGGWWRPDGAGLRLATDADSPVTIADDGQGGGRQVAGIATVPRVMAVAHYDPARDWQAGVQRVARVGAETGPAATGGAGRVDLPAALAADAARDLAARLLANAMAARTMRVVVPGLAGMTVKPGAVVTVAGEAGRWRVLASEVEGMVVRLTLTPLPGAPPALPGATSGRVAGSPDQRIGVTLLRVMELPALDDTLATAPRILVAAAGAGAGWRGASLSWSGDDGASWEEAGVTAAPAVLGTVEADLPAATSCLYDMINRPVVRLARGDMVLADADDAALDRGGNLAVVGDEIIQFGRAEPLGEGRWRLSRLLRGRRGSEGATVAAGAPFALLSADAVRGITLPLALLGRPIRVMASGAGDGVPAEARLTLTGASLRPPVPVAIVRQGDAAGWTRRSRAGWAWNDGSDAPLGEEAERYRVSLTAPDGSVRDVAVDAAQLAGPVLPGTIVTVRQRGTWAESAPATARL